MARLINCVILFMLLIKFTKNLQSINKLLKIELLTENLQNQNKQHNRFINLNIIAVNSQFFKNPP